MLRDNQAELPVREMRGVVVNPMDREPTSDGTNSNPNSQPASRSTSPEGWSFKRKAITAGLTLLALGAAAGATYTGLKFGGVLDGQDGNGKDTAEDRTRTMSESLTFPNYVSKPNRTIFQGCNVTVNPYRQGQVDNYGSFTRDGTEKTYICPDGSILHETTGAAIRRGLNTAWRRLSCISNQTDAVKNHYAYNGGMQEMVGGLISMFNIVPDADRRLHCVNNPAPRCERTEAELLQVVTTHCQYYTLQKEESRSASLSDEFTASQTLDVPAAGAGRREEDSIQKPPAKAERKNDTNATDNSWTGKLARTAKTLANSSRI